MNSKLLGIFLLFIVGCGGGCKENKPTHQPMTQADVEESLIDMHRQNVVEENNRIQTFIADKGWEMQSTQTGLRYDIYEHGDAELITSGDAVLCDYSIKLLDGTVCYSSDEGKELEFIVGMADLASGIHEGIQLLRKGDKCRMVLPARLGYGLSGDQEKIPGNSALWVELFVKDVMK